MNPANAEWTFTGAAGISGNGSTVNAGNSAAPEGGQAAFLQGGSESFIEQKINGFDATRSYQLSFQAAQGWADRRSAPPTTAQFEVFFDNLSLGVYEVSAASYVSLTTPAFTVPPTGSGTVRFVARNEKESTTTVLLDNVTLTGNAPGTNNADVRWLVTDHLGTPRMIVGLAGTLADVRRHDYLPFGEELVALQTPYRLANNGYVADGVRQKFGSYERDNETGLDYAQARYYANVQGRFTSPDIPLADQDVADPQSWNLYSYVRNNPLAFTDPTGRYECDANGNCRGVRDGEKNGDLYWNAKGKVWESGSEFVARVGKDKKDQCDCHFPRDSQRTWPSTQAVEPPQMIPIVSGFREFWNSKEGQLAVTFLPLPGTLIAKVLTKLNFLVRPGAGKAVVEIVGDVKDAKVLFDELRGANTATQVAPGVFTAKPYTGPGTLTFRATSQSGPPTVDVHGMGDWAKIKFVPK
ncbi:MAG: RHS repeat-associated core domain-containing protein [Acidobacteria bacterium]|nr:RHS repeat-associated core domain-containing protein [Acidobacteriota bacterium]MBI3425798.1 RHS repeat-associated core domain-containing protein [Acidobacteriota bacterium]